MDGFESRCQGVDDKQAGNNTNLKSAPHGKSCANLLFGDGQLTEMLPTIARGNKPKLPFKKYQPDSRQITGMSIGIKNVHVRP